MFSNRIATAARTSLVAGVFGATVIGATIAGTGAAFAAPSQSADDETYLSALESENISFPTDAKAINLAHHICDSLDSGVTFDEIVDEGREQSELGDYEIGFVIGASVLVYCPEFEDVLPS